MWYHNVCMSITQTEIRTYKVLVSVRDSTTYPTVRDISAYKVGGFSVANLKEINSDLTLVQRP